MINDAGRHPGGWRGWREATEQALYGPAGFFMRERPAGHFRTSVHASPLFAAALAELLGRVDAALGRPDPLDVVDVGAGRGELLTGVLTAVAGPGPVPGGRPEPEPGHPEPEPGRPEPEPGRPEPEPGRPALADRLRLHAVERAPRPAGLDERIRWLAELPQPRTVTGLLFANEWLDNVPVEVVETDAAGVSRLVLVASDGSERLGPPVTDADARWQARWWPPTGERGLRGEIGRPRDDAWARAVRSLDRGLAVAVDYTHERAARPPFGTLTGFRDGREVRPVPDGSCDITAHVALDACARAGADAVLAASGAEASPCAGTGTDAGVGAGTGPGAGPGVEEGGPYGPGAPVVLSQRDALRALGTDGRRPPLALASSDPAAYVRALGSAGEAAELTDPGGLGGFGWLVQPVGTSRSQVGL